MKWIAWGLLLANVLVAGYFIGRSHWPQTSPQNATALNVDQLSLRGQSALPPMQPPASTNPQTPAQATALCVEWRGLRPDELIPVREQLKALAGERILSFSEVPLSTRFWVIFPPLPSELAAVAKLAELAAAGVNETFVVKQGAWRHAISLGLYANAEAARRRVSEVERKGVLGTRIEVQARQGSGYYFMIRSEDPEVLKNLSDLKQPYPNSQQSRVACPA
jgi:hypothetical protein